MTTPHDLLRFALLAAHVLAGAAWFGAMFYSYTVLHPRGQHYFQKPEAFEPFITAVSAGARWKVLGAMALVAASGVVLAALQAGRGVSLGWLWLVGLKTVGFAVALGLFAWVSWRLWPARVMASRREIPAYQQRFRRVSLAMIVLAGLNIALGVALHTLARP